MCVAGLLDAMRSKLPAGARIVWMCLENHADDNRKWMMSLERIVSEVHLSIEAVKRAVRLLESRGIIRGDRDGPGRKATTWHMLRSYDPPPHNGGINGEEYPQNDGIKEPKTTRSNGIETGGFPQNEGISRFPPQTPPFSTHPRKNPPVAPPSGGPRRAAKPKFRNGFRALDAEAGGLVIDATAEEVADFDAFRSNLRLVGGDRG